MAEYYLISQLPSLDGVFENTPLPITEERFTELCSGFISKKMKKEMDKLSLIPPTTPERSSSALVEKWNEGERNLRLYLAKCRADKMNKHFDSDNKAVSPELMQTVKTALELESPMEAEIFLNRYRLGFLEGLRPMDPFSEEYLFYYALKLKLIERIKQFDTQRGKAAYRNIYDSIMNGDRSEA